MLTRPSAGTVIVLGSIPALIKERPPNESLPWLNTINTVDLWMLYDRSALGDMLTFLRIIDTTVDVVVLGEDWDADPITRIVLPITLVRETPIVFSDGSAATPDAVEGYLSEQTGTAQDAVVLPIHPAEPVSATSAPGRVADMSAGGRAKERKEVQISLVPPGPLRELSVLYARGAKKYAAHNWMNEGPWSWSYDAAMRHLTTFWAGEDYDAETGVKHVINAAFNLFALAHAMEAHPGSDDRPPATHYQGAIPLQAAIDNILPTSTEAEETNTAASG